MNTASLILAGLIIVPIALILWLRINATLVFLSLCLGNVLVQFVAKGTQDLLTLNAQQIPSKLSTTDSSTIKLGLLILPVILTMVFMIRTVHGHGKLFLNVLPAVGVGLLGALLVVPLLPSNLSQQILTSNLWQQVDRAQDLIVGASALACLLVLWLQRPKTGHKEGKKSKHEA